MFFYTNYQKSVLFFLFFLFPLIVKAQNNVKAQNKSDTMRVEVREIIVTGTYSNISNINPPLSLSLESRTPNEITGSAAISLNSITHHLPGVWLTRRHTNALGDRLLIRGQGWRATFGVRGVQAVLNGIPLTMPDGSSVLNIIDPDVIKRLEVIRGPSSTYWGNSSGGVLYLSSQPNYSSSNHLRLRMYGGSYGLAKGIVQYHNQIGRHKLSAYSSYQIEDGYRDYSASRLFRAGLQGSYKISNKSHLDYTGAFFSMPKAQNPSALTAKQVAVNPVQANTAYVQHKSGKQAKQGQLGLNYYRHTSAGLLTLTGYGIFRNLFNPLPFAIINVDRLAGGFRGTLQKNMHHFRVKGGIELKTQHDDRNEYVNDHGSRGDPTVDEVEKVHNSAVYVNATYLWNKFEMKGSLRYDRLTFKTDAQNTANTGKRTFGALSPGIGISFHPHLAEFYVNLNTSFQAPTTTELTNRPGGGNGFNAHLEPEHTLGLEAGSRGNLFKNRLKFDIALYRLWIHDLLFPYQLRPDGAEFYRNNGKTRNSGLELSTSIRLLPKLQLKAMYNFIFARFRKAQILDSLSLKGKDVPGIPRNRFNMSMAWTPASFWVQLRNKFVSSYTVNELNNAFNDAYWVTDLKISYHYNFRHSNMKLIPFVNLNNIFNERYNGAVGVNARGGKYYYPAPGRNWRAGFSLSFY